MENSALRVGFGRSNITPNEPVPLAGYGNTSFRFFKNVRDEIQAGCIAVSDAAGSTVLLFDLDLIVMDEPVLGRIRESIEKALGITGDRVMTCCTHTHSGPDIWNMKEPSICRYHDLLVEKLTEAAARAMEDRKEARMLYGSVEVYNMNFVKHYCHTTAEGETKYFGDNFGTTVYDDTTRHATDADPSLHILQFQREGGKDIVAVNWRGHPHFTSGSKKYDLSADYMGAYRRCLEQMRDCHAVFFQGCGGNLNSSTRLPHERRFTSCDSYGMALAAATVEGLEKYMTEARSGAVSTKQVMLTGKLDHSKDHLVPVAQEALAVWKETNDYAKVMELARPHGIRSPYHANAIVSKSKRPETMELELNAIAIGPDVGFVTGSEMYDTVSMMTEEGSTFAATVTLGYCSAYRGYIPSKFGFEYTSYESDVAWFSPGIGEQIAESFIQMLNELKNN